MCLKRVPEQVRYRLDDFNFWIGIAYFGLVCVVVWLFFLNQRTAHNEARAAAERATLALRQRTQAESTYRGCVASIPELRAISEHLGGVNDLAAVLLLNSGSQLDATRVNDPLHQVRVKSFVRLAHAVSDIAAIRSLHVPTVKECAARRTAVLRS